MDQNWKKNIVIFMASQALSIFGSSLVQFAITWHITLTTKSGIYSMLIIVCGFLPTFFLSPFAGVWADRYNRKRLIILADAGIALCTLLLAILFSLGHNTVWLLLTAAGIRALGSAVQNPCVGAMIPDIVPPEHFTRINGINGTLQSLIMLVSPMVSGALLSMASIKHIFFIDVVTAVIAIVVLLAFLKLPPPLKAVRSERNDYLRELKQGFAYIGNRPYLKNFFLFSSLFFVMAAPVAFLTPLQTTRAFGEDVWRLTAIEITFSVGMMVGGLLITAWGGLRNRIHTMALAGTVMGAVTIALGFPSFFGLYLGLMALFGVAMPVFNTPAVVLLQERVDPDYMGRVFGVMTMISSSMMPMGMILFGPLADIVRIEWLLIGTGAVILFSSMALLRNRPLLEVGAKITAGPGAGA